MKVSSIKYNKTQLIAGTNGAICIVTYFSKKLIGSDFMIRL